MQQMYDDQVAQKEKDRIEKSASKAKAEENEKHAAFAFDFEQVIFLPLTKRSEIFYKRRLSNYNFTLYNLNSKDSWAFVWHECMAGRGANEVVSCVYQYLMQLDSQKVETVDMFCNDCTGQNKNSIILAMMLNVVENSTYIKRIRLVVMVPYHGQNENDTIHSCVERALKRCSYHHSWSL